MLSDNLNVGMSAEKNLSLAKPRQIVLVPDVTVGCEDSCVAVLYSDSGRGYQKVEHHLVYLRLAVSANAHNVVGIRIQHLNYLFGGIFLGKIVSRSVVENVAEKKQKIRLFGFIRLEHFSAPIGRAVNITCNKNFHIITSS